MKILYIDHSPDISLALLPLLDSEGYSATFVQVDPHATDVLHNALLAEMPDVVLIGGYKGGYKQFVEEAQDFVGANWAIISGTDFSVEVGEGHYTEHNRKALIPFLERMGQSVEGESEG